MCFGGAGGEGSTVEPSKELDQDWESEEAEGRVFSFKECRGGTQTAGTVSKNGHVEATGTCWAEHFLISGRFKSHFAPRHLSWESKHPRGAICSRRDCE